MNFQVGLFSITLSENVRNIFCHFRQINSVSLEAGGIILGQVSPDGHEINIKRVSIPSQYDKRYRFGFLRKKDWAQQVIEYEHFNSCGRNTYLGEWHTHPVEKAKPSIQDLKMISNQYTKNELQVDKLLLIIVAKKEIFIGIESGSGLSEKSEHPFLCAKL